VQRSKLEATPPARQSPMGSLPTRSRSNSATIHSAHNAWAPRTSRSVTASPWRAALTRRAARRTSAASTREQVNATARAAAGDNQDTRFPSNTFPQSPATPRLSSPSYHECAPARVPYRRSLTGGHRTMAVGGRGPGGSTAQAGYSPGQHCRSHLAGRQCGFLCGPVSIQVQNGRTLLLDELVGVSGGQDVGRGG